MTARWQDFAVCATTDPELFFPEAGETSRPAKKVCAVCPVVTQCLEMVVGRDVPGVWGGLSRAERAAMRREAS